MAHKKGVGSSNNGRDSKSKRLGVKIYGGQLAISGNIIVRQRGTAFHPGTGVGIGKDHTIYAITDGKVQFTKRRKDRTFISVVPLTDEEWSALGLPPRPEKVAKKAKPVKKATNDVVNDAPAAAAPSAVSEEE